MKNKRKSKKINYEESDEDYSLSSEYSEDDEESEYSEDSQNIPNKSKNENIKTAKKNIKKNIKENFLGKKMERNLENENKNPKLKKKFHNPKNNNKINNNNNNNNNINTIELKEQNPFDYKTNYFYQNLTQNECGQISKFLSQSLQNPNLSNKDLSNFFTNFPNLYRGENNLNKIFQILNGLTTNKTNINTYKLIINFMINTYYMAKPSIFQVYFFPNPSNEIHVINMISTCKSSLDICIFTINSKNFYETIKTLYERNINIRIITDDEMAKNPTSNIYSLAALGIPIKTDDNPRYYMHHKFAVIDKSVVITGSFNWTNQAINLAKKYTEEFEKLWNNFIISISKQNAIHKCKEDEEKRKAIEQKKLFEKEKKLKEKYGDDYIKYMKPKETKKNNNNIINNQYFNKINYEQNIYNYNQNNYDNNNSNSEMNLNEKKSNWSCIIF